MAYKFQIGEAKLSGSITQTSGSGDLQALTVDSLDASNGGISNAGAIAGVTTVSGSGQFQVGSIAIGGTAVSATATEINALDGADGFNSISGKAMIRDTNGLTIDGLVNGNASFVLDCDDNGDASSLKIRQGNNDQDDIELKAGSGISLDAGANFINASEINVLNAVTAGTAAASKALVLDSSLDIAGINTGSFGEVSASGMILAAEVNFDDVSGIAGNVLTDNLGVLDVSLASAGGLEEASNELQIKVATVAGLETDANGLKLRLGFASGLEISGSGPGELNVKVSGSSLTKDGDGLKINTGGVSNDMLAGSIANAKLANQSVSFGGVTLNLGDTDATPAFDLADATNYPGDSALVTVGALDAGSITSNFGSINVGSSAISTTGTGSFGKVVISGDLEVAGDLTYVNTTNLRVADAKVVFADGASGLAAGQGFYIGSDAGDATEKASFAVGNGGGTNDAFVSSLNISASAYYGDGSNLSGVTADSAAVLFEQTASVSTTTKTLDVQNDGTFVLVDNSSNVVAITLPAAADADGMTFKIKKTTSNTVNAVTVDASGSQTIDGDSAAINLDSPYAAVNLFSDGTQWLIY